MKKHYSFFLLPLFFLPVFFAQAQTDSLKLEEQIAAVDSLLDGRQYKTVVARCDSLLALLPESDQRARLSFLKGSALLKTRKYKEAEAQLKETLLYWQQSLASTWSMLWKTISRP